MKYVWIVLEEASDGYFIAGVLSSLAKAEHLAQQGDFGNNPCGVYLPHIEQWEVDTGTHYISHVRCIDGKVFRVPGQAAE